VIEPKRVKPNTLILKQHHSINCYSKFTTRATTIIIPLSIHLNKQDNSNLNPKLLLLFVLRTYTKKLNPDLDCFVCFIFLAFLHYINKTIDSLQPPCIPSLHYSLSSDILWKRFSSLFYLSHIIFEKSFIQNNPNKHVKTP